MLKRHRFLIIVLSIFAILDALAWRATYYLVNLPSPEELRHSAAETSSPPPSSVQLRGDGFHQRLSLNGLWQYRQTGGEIQEDYFTAVGSTDSAWHTMEIPQNWYLAGLNYHGVIWFRRQFEAEADWQGRAVRLAFEGVDYLADVYLNGKKLGHHEGYFEPFTFDVSDQLNYGGVNTLVVRVESPYEEYRAVWPRQKALIKGVFGQSNTHPGAGWGWAGQDFNTGGIWDEVALVISDFAAIEGVQLRASWDNFDFNATSGDPGWATLLAYVTLHNYAAQAVPVSVSLTLTPRNFEGEAISVPAKDIPLEPGQTQVELRGIVRNPQLWWTWDRGDPRMYTARVVVTAGDRPTQVLAEEEIPFSFRQITVGKDWAWSLNGQRFFARGSNYISSQWLSQTNEAWFRHDVQLMREANLNFVRVYAHVEPEEFYRITDELGLLVWQDFPLQWAYSDAPTFIDEAQRQMRAMIELRYNHPSIALWNVHNESPWASPWMAELITGYDARQNKRLDELLQDIGRRLDPNRQTHLVSGSSDAHVYAGWNSGRWRDYASLPGAPFVSEFGAQALPNLEMMQQIFSPKELVYQSGAIRERWEYHGFQPRQTFDIAHVEQGESLETFIANSQAYQVNLLRFAIETYRRAKYDPMQGIFQFMFVDNWPAIGWSVLDYDRQPKPGYYALQTAMQPILPSLNAPLPDAVEGTRWIYSAESPPAFQIWAINDTLERYTNAQLVWRLTNEEGTVTEQSMKINIHPDSAVQKMLLRDLQLEVGKYRLDLELRDEQQKLLGHNQFEFEIQ